MHPVLSELTARIDARWREVSYDEQALPEIASEVLREGVLVSRQELRPSAIFQWLIREATDLPPQRSLHAHAGSTTIVAHRGELLGVDLVVLREGAEVELHQHAATGAFALLGGMHAQVRYAFTQRHRISDRVLLGEVRPEAVDILGPGAVRALGAGIGSVHSLVVLEDPVLLLRVRAARPGAPSLRYLPPHLALAARRPELLSRQLEVLALVRGLPADGEGSSSALLRALAERADAYSLATLVEVLAREGEAEQIRELLEHAAPRNRALAEVLGPVSVELSRRSLLARIGAAQTEPGLRLFLTLLAAFPTRAAIVAAVEQRFPERPAIDSIMSWVEQLTRPGRSYLGIDLEPGELLVLRCLIEGVRPAELPARLAALAKGSEELPEGEGIDLLCSAFQRSALFRPLLS